MKTILTISLLLISLGVVVGCNQQKQAPLPYHKWDVKICNSLGCDHYDCDSFKQDGNNYILMDSAGNVINQLTMSPGIAIVASVNK
jgi:hypothetical protein